MSGHLISPLTLPKLSDERLTSRADRSRRSLPLPVLPSQPAGSLLYVLTVVDGRGRVIAHGLFTAFGWLPGTSLELRQVGGRVLISAAEGESCALNSRGHLYLPLALRRWCRLEDGARVLLVGEPERQRLVIHPLATLDEMFRGLHIDLVGGDGS